MHLSIWSSYFMELQPEAMAETLSSAGWSHSELSTEHSQVLLDRGDPEGEGRRFRRFAEDRGVRFPQGHLWLQCDVCAPNQDEVVDTLKRWLDLYRAIGVEAAVVHPGGKGMIKEGRPPEAILERRVRALRALCEHVREAGMDICLENILATARDVDELLEIVKAAAAPNLAICLDTGHLNIAGGDQAEFIAKAGERLKALHVADNEGQTDQHLMPYGRGTVPWPEVASALERIGYEGLFNLEIPGERNAPMAVKLAKLDYLKRAMAALVDGRLETENGQ